MASVSPSSNLPSQYLAYKQRTEAAALAEARVGSASCFSGSFKNLQEGTSWTMAGASEDKASGAEAFAPPTPPTATSMSSPYGTDKAKNSSTFWSRFSKNASGDQLPPPACAELKSPTPSGDNAVTNFDRLRSMAEQSVRKPEIPEVENLPVHEQPPPVIVLSTPPSVQSLSSSEASSMGDSSEVLPTNTRFSNLLGSFSKIVSSKKQETKQEINVAELLKKRDQSVGLVPKQQKDETMPSEGGLLEVSLESQIGDLEREMGLTTTTTSEQAVSVPTTPQLRMDGFDDVHEDGDDDDMNTVHLDPSTSTTSSPLDKLKNAMPPIPKMATMSWGNAAKQPPVAKLSGGL